MLCQQYLITEGVGGGVEKGNPAILCLHHNTTECGILLCVRVTSEGEKHSHYQNVSGSMVGTPPGAPTLTAERSMTVGCVCVQTRSVNTYWMKEREESGSGAVVSENTHTDPRAS